MAAVGERHLVTAEVAMWLSSKGLGACEVLAQVTNDWLDQQSPAGLRDWHRALEISAKQRQRRREEAPSAPASSTNRRSGDKARA
jgi:hypothetical protein